MKLLTQRRCQEALGGKEVRRMGFWDHDVNNSLDAMFDFNRDGVLNAGEQAMKYEFLSGELDGDDYNDNDGGDWGDF